MFKRLFLLSGIIAFLLACALMYFWYLPNHPTDNSTTVETASDSEVITTKPDSLEAISIE